MPKQSVNTGSTAEQYARITGVDASEHIDKPNAIQKVEEAAVKHVQEVEAERAEEAKEEKAPAKKTAAKKTAAKKS